MLKTPKLGIEFKKRLQTPDVAGSLTNQDNIKRD